VNGRASELRATYRLQLTSSFGFAAARALVPYLRDLGISHLYLSPSFQARPGSTHGYDVIDPRRVSDDLGGESELRALSGVARDAGMGVILDVVPNHMAADDANHYWSDPQLRPTDVLRPYLERGYHIYLLPANYWPWRYLWSKDVRAPKRLRDLARLEHRSRFDMVLSRIDADEL